MTPRFNLEERRLLDLARQTRRMADAYGSKSANLGEVARSRLAGVTVPAGFGIPTYYYDRFVKENGLEDALVEMMGDQKFVHDPAYRREKLVEAVKTVWASLWNFEAYEARERANIDHSKAYMAVLVQEGVNADSAGVMITTDPFDSDNRGAIYISAKRGLGIKVVEGKRIPEQLLFLPRANQVKVLTRSEEDSLLTFDDAGGVKEVPISGERAVLTDEVVRKLARAASLIKGVFRGREQDIEWVYMRGQIFIVQSRPFVQGS